jgi:saccharopine dehydrogenase-like NADP-dependent oxidoreductase
MAKILILGHGRVGQVIGHDLIESGHEVTAADTNPQSSGLWGAKQVHIKDIYEGYDLASEADVVVGALPGSRGQEALHHMVTLVRKPYIDVSFMPENPLELDILAKNNDTVAVVDMGLAPGIGNLCIGCSYAEMDDFQCEDVIYYVGGSPRAPYSPTKYYTTWSVEGVVQEYATSARIRRGGQLQHALPMSDIQPLSTPVGEMESALTDGLRTLLFTLQDIPNIEERTLRWPGHWQLMNDLAEMGFFFEENREHTAKILEKHWEEYPSKEDFVYLRVYVRGRQGGKRTVHLYEMFDEYDLRYMQSAMARTTAFACTAAVEWISEGLWAKPGVWAPEQLGMEHSHDFFELLQTHLKMRGIFLTREVHRE